MITIGGEFLSALGIKASAAEAVELTSFAESSIEDDLENVDLSNYPYNAFGEPEIISFVEYCYSDVDYYSENYALYVYVYNPTEKYIIRADEYNSVNMVVGYDENGSAVFDNVNLEYVDSTSDNRFYKFRLSESGKLLEMARAYSLLNGVRRYEIAGVQIRYNDETVDNEVSCAYEWTGYAGYCSSDRSPISTLACNNVGTRTIHLELEHTNYRFATQEGTYIQDDLNSVYFSIPEEYFQDFGNLSKISAEWYEYKTAPIFVTSDKEAYAALWEMRNKRINEYGHDMDWIEAGNEGPYYPLSFWRVFWEARTFPEFTDNPTIYFGQTYNGKCRDDIDDTSNLTLGGFLGDKEAWIYLDTLNWLFYVEDVTGSDGYYVPKEEVIEYMEKYTNTFYDQEKIREKYALGLFSKMIDRDRFQFLEDELEYFGHVKMDFYAGRDFEFNSGNSFIDASSSQSAWNKFWFGTKYEPYTYSPICVIKESDLILDSDAFSEKYYVNKHDVADVMKSAREAYDNCERPVLLRFAVTDYYASTAYFDFAEEDGVSMTEPDGYVAQETVFLDFDVLSMGFENEDGYNEVVIGVVANPIDIINGLTPPDGLVEDEEWWQKIMMGIMLIIIILLCVFFSGPIGVALKVIFDGVMFFFSLILKILLAPFKLLGWLFKSG